MSNHTKELDKLLVVAAQTAEALDPLYPIQMRLSELEDVIYLMTEGFERLCKARVIRGKVRTRYGRALRAVQYEYDNIKLKLEASRKGHTP